MKKMQERNRLYVTFSIVGKPYRFVIDCGYIEVAEYVKEVLSGYSKVKNIRFNTRGGIKNGYGLDETCWQSLLEQIIRE